MSATTNNFRVSISKNDGKANYKISIRLNDECRNGHEDFAITADFWTVGKSRIDRNLERGGCCHDEILKVRPDLKPFVDLHLCDWQGAPMYPKADGFHNLKRYPMAEFCEYFNCTPNEWAQLKAAEDEAHFWYLLTKSEIPARWKKSALAAIKTLEKIAGVSFESTATKSHFEPMPAEQLAEMEEKIASGYYTPEALKERAEEKAREKMGERLAAIEQQYTDEEWKARKNRDVSLFVALATGNESGNLIFYGHNDTLCLNWLEYGAKFTSEQIAEVKARIGELEFPVTVTVGPKG